MSAPALFEQIENSSVGDAIRESPWMFQTLETLHVLAIVLVLGSIVRVDLRLLWASSKGRPVTELTAELLPWTWTCFAIAAVSGALLFTSAATKYYDNVPFRLKLLLMFAAGLNMLVFHASAYRKVASWDLGATPLSARLCGGISIASWTAVALFGRWIGFT